MRLLVLSASLHPQSRSREMARRVYQRLKFREAETGWLDLADLDLPLCDGKAAYGHPDASRTAGEVGRADGIVLATPVYNYGVSASVKNLVELTGSRCWSGKVVALVSAAGGNASYMAPMGLLNSLMLDFRTVVVPRFVYATGGAFADGKLNDPEVIARLEGLADRFAAMTEALRPLLLGDREK